MTDPDIRKVREALDFLTEHVGKDYLNRKQRQEIERAHEHIRTLRILYEALLKDLEAGESSFDQYLENQGHSTEKRDPEEWGDATYKHPEIEAMYDGWKAAIKAAPKSEVEKVMGGEND